MENWYRRHLEDEYGPEFLQRMDEAEARLADKNSPACGPVGECACGGTLVYLFNQDVNYCAECDTEYPDSISSPAVKGAK